MESTMRFFFLLAFLSFPDCFAQTNPMGYFYRGRYKEAFPDFAALAVLERQNCPKDIIREGNQICTSRYRIIRILDVVSAAFRKKHLEKEYLEAKEKPVYPYFRHRPVLIFGKHRDEHLQIEGYEDIRGYFGTFDALEAYVENSIENYYYKPYWYPFAGSTGLGDIYAFHSIGTPYYKTSNLDSIDMLYYNEYLMPYLKRHTEAAGKDFSKLQLRSIQNRTQIKAAKIKNDFVALGAIKNIHLSGNPKRANLYELKLMIETVIKNDAKIDSNIAIFIDRDRLPLGWSCKPLEHYVKMKVPFYFFGNSKSGSLVIDSLVSVQDAFVFGDTIYDISMGFPFDELFSYFIPSNMSIEEYKFGTNWEFLRYSEISEIPEWLADEPECLRNSVIEVTMKWADYIDNYKRQSREKEKLKFDWPFHKFPVLSDDEKFSCRVSNRLKICRKPDYLKTKEVWGK